MKAGMMKATQAVIVIRVLPSLILVARSNCLRCVTSCNDCVFDLAAAKPGVRTTAGAGAHAGAGAEGATLRAVAAR